MCCKHNGGDGNRLCRDYIGAMGHVAHRGGTEERGPQLRSWVIEEGGD